MDETIAQLMLDEKVLMTLQILENYINNTFQASLDHYKGIAEKNGLPLDVDTVDLCGLWAARDTLIAFNNSLKVDISCSTAMQQSVGQVKH